jgi:phage tail-like protein
VTPPATTTGGATGAAPGTAVDTLVDLVFLVEIQGRRIGQFAECSGLAVEYDMTEYVEGGNNLFTHRFRGHAKYPNVTLRRGVTFEDELLRWFYTWEQRDARPTVTITLLDHTGKRVRYWALDAAQPVKWTGPDGKAGGNGAATESLEIGHEGFL